MAQTVEELAELIDSLKVETGRNADSFDKLLTSINNKLALMAEDTKADDLIKVYLAELKKTLEDRHSVMVSEFSKIEKSFKSLSDEQENLIKTSEMREMFDIFSVNMQSIAQELFNQKEILAQYDERFEAFVADKTDKNDIITSVAAIKNDVDVINKGFEASILDINSNIHSILKNLIVMDPTAQNDIVKRELENIYLSVNAILASLHAVEQKNDDLAAVLEKFVTKDDMKEYQETLDSMVDKSDVILGKFDTVVEKTDLDSIIYKSSEISDKINSLPKKEDLEYFVAKTNEVSSKLTELPQKSDITEISEKLDNTLTGQDFEQIIVKANSIEDKISTLPQHSDFADVYTAIKSFSEILDTLRTSLTSSNENTNTMVREQLDKLNNVLSAVVTESDFKGFRNDLADFIQKIIDNSSALNENLNVNKETLENLITQIEALDIYKNMNAITSAIEGFKETAESNMEKLSTDIKDIPAQINDTVIANIEENMGTITENLAETSESIKSFRNEVLEKLSDYNSEKFQTLNNSMEFLRETIVSSQASNESDLSEKLLALRDMITVGGSGRDSKLLELKEKLDEFLVNVENISEDTKVKIGNSIAEINELKTEIEVISKAFSELNYAQDERDSKIVNMISSELGEISVSINTLQDSVQAGIHKELADNAEVVDSQIDKLIQTIESFKTDMNETESEFDFEVAFKELKDKITAVKQEVNLVNTDIIDVVNSKTDALMIELKAFQEALDEFTDLEDTVNSRFKDLNESQAELITRVISEVKLIIAENLDANSDFSTVKEELVDEITNKIGGRIIDSTDEITDTIIDKVNDSAEDIKDVLTEKIVTNSDELKTLLTEALNNDELKDTITETFNIDKLRDLLENSLNNDALNDSLNELGSDIKGKIEQLFEENNRFDEVIEQTGGISGSNAKITSLLDALNQKIDILVMSDDADGDDLQEELNEVKSMISSQKSILEKSSNLEKITEIESRLQDLLGKIESIENVDLANMRESILTAILNVFEQISFIEESEDIKDFVEEKTDEINQNLNEVKEQLKHIVNSDDDYSYTLQDVESDIAKLRLVLNEISSTSSNDGLSEISDNIHRIVSSVEDLQTSLTQEQITDLKSDFEKLNEDIVSISSRTNKLLLNSDESYNALNNGLNDFSNVIYKLEERINYLDNKEITERIEAKLDNVSKYAAESVNSDKVMRQALMYLGEWIDTTSENIASLCEQSVKVDEIQQTLEDLKNQFDEQSVVFQNIVQGFEEQEERMDRLEMKLEKILSAIDDIDDTKLTKKVDKIDKQLTKLTGTIEKLASYVDE